MLLELMLSRRPRKAIADDMECSEPSLSDWLNPGRPGGMPVWWLVAWTREVGPGLLRWIAKENGLGLVDADELGPAELVDAAQLLALICTHHGRLVGQIIQAREDGVITEEEKAQIWPEIQRLIRELEAEAEVFKPRDQRRAAGGES